MTLFAKAPNGLLVRAEPYAEGPGGVGWTGAIGEAQSWESQEEVLAWCADKSANLVKWVRTGIADPGPGYNKDAVRLVTLEYLVAREYPARYV